MSDTIIIFGNQESLAIVHYDSSNHKITFHRLQQETMKVVALLLIALWSLFHFTSGMIVLQVLLNNGRPLATGEDCSDAEWALINATITTLSQNQRRGLRDTESNQINDMSMEDDRINTGKNRSLAYYPPSCKSKCQGYASKCCLVVNCKGYRRKRSYVRGLLDSTYGSNNTDTDKWNDPERALFYSTSCNNQKTEMKNWLNNLANQVSFNCSKVLRAPRNMTCFNSTQC